MKQPIFVVGVPRSGTTLLQAILGRHADTYTLPETHFFEQVLPNLGRSAADVLDADEARQALTELEQLMELGLEQEARQALIRRAQAGHLSGRELFEFVIEWYRPAEDEQRWMRPIEKTPGHVQQLDEILVAHPDARFIHIIREPKNAISSLLMTPFVRSRWLIWHCVRWNATLGYVERFAAAHPGSLLTIRYEDLVTEPRRIMGEVCTFLGLVYSEQILPQEDESVEGPLMLPRETWKREARGPVMANSPEAWRERIGEAEGWFIERLTRRRSARYGYQANASPGFKAKAVTSWRQWWFVSNNPRERDVGIWLLEKCMQMGEVGPARQLAIAFAAGDVRMLGHRRVRAALRGSTRSGVEAVR